MNEIDRHQVSDWSMLMEGDKLIWSTPELEGASNTYCTVCDVFDDHAVAATDGETTPSIWIDKHNQYEFYYVKSVPHNAKKVTDLQDVEGATYKNYNANNRGTNAPDCVKRAISMAFNMDYNAVSKLLIAKAKAKHKAHWNIHQVYEPVIFELGGEFGQAPDKIIQVQDFIDQYVPQGVCIIETCKKPNQPGYGDHLTCCVNGVLYDSWDSSDQYVCQYYMVPNAVHEFTDIADRIHELRDEGLEMLGQLWAKYRDKYNLPGEFVNQGSTKKTDFAFYYRLRYKDNAVNEVWNLDCIFTPTMSPEAARKKMIETLKIRMYDKFYAINHKRLQKLEGDSLFYESGYTDEDRRNLYMDGREQRFFDSLPGWIKPFITYLNVQEPGQWSDSYDVTALPIKGDPDRSKVKFYGYQAADVKDKIARYKKNFERE